MAIDTRTAERNFNTCGREGLENSRWRRGIVREGAREAGSSGGILLRKV